MSPRQILFLLKDTIKEWLEDDAPQLAAALAFYSILSLVPLIIITLAITGFFFGEEAARGELVNQIDGLVGSEAAKGIQEILASTAREEKTGIIATIFGVITLLVGASGIFAQLQGALNHIWNVEKKKGSGIITVIRTRLLSFTMVFASGFLLLTSLIISAVLTALGNYASELAPGFPLLMQLINQLVSLGIISLVFACIFKYLPDVKISWKDVVAGALLSAILFNLGKFGIGLYLGKSAISSSYGAAGSLVVMLIWVFASSLILLFGAEFTQVYSHRYGSRRNVRTNNPQSLSKSSSAPRPPSPMVAGQ
jgi:membrane protein